MEVLCDVARRFDVVAIQEVRAREDDILPRFVRQINAGGRKYDFLIGPRLGRTQSKEQYAFVYDTATIETDRTALYTVMDPRDLLHREPLVGSFRVRGPPPGEAFTFTLVNLHTDPDEVSQEVDALAQVERAVRADGRGEDDVILLGDFNADERGFGALGLTPNITWVISGVPTNTLGNHTYDNILFHRIATGEFTGMSGVVDLMRDYRLTLDQAREVSDHLPIWAEFSALEGGQPGRIATRPREAAAR
jgi:endonuclease/exonuclease/phosphatase family metal-dependent hydrolase